MLQRFRVLHFCVAIILCPLMAQAEIVILKYSCEAYRTGAAPMGDQDVSYMDGFVGNCTPVPNLQSKTYNFPYADEQMPKRLAAHAAAVKESEDKLKAHGHIVYTKGDIDGLLKAHFLETENKLNDMRNSLPVVLGETDEKSIRNNLRDTIKNLLATDEEFRQELAQILNSK